MSNIGRDAECVVGGSVEEDEEIAWINSAMWNDSLWVENNYSWELDEGGHFCNENRISSTLNSETVTTTNWNDTKQHQNVEDYSSEDSGTCDFVEEDEFCFGTMYENYTDDIKLSLVNTLLSRHKGKSGRVKSSTVKPCCDQKHVFRGKYDYLRRSSPSSSCSPSSRASSTSSLGSISRQSRSLSPQLLRRTVEAYRADLSKSKIYRNCCNNNGYQHREISPLTRQQLSPNLSSWSKDRTGNVAQLRRSSPTFRDIQNRQSRSMSPLATENVNGKSSETHCIPGCDSHQSKLPQHIYYGRGFKMKQGHSVISPIDGGHKPRADTLRNPPMRYRSNSPASLTPPPTRKSRSLSPQLIRAIDSHKTDMSQRLIYRDCCNGRSQTPNSKTKSHGIKQLSPKSASPTFPRRVSSSRSAGHQFHSVDKVPAANSVKTSTVRCSRPCCEQKYNTHPKFDYLRKGSGIKRYTHLPEASNSKEHSLNRRNQLSPLSKHRTTPSKTHHSYANNTIHTLGTKSPTASSSPLPQNTPICITLKHPSVDEPDGGEGCKEPVVCDEVLLEFPTLYYKLDCSEQDGDLELESRKAKSGTVYRILDDGNVARECDLDKQNYIAQPSGDDATEEVDKLADDSSRSPDLTQRSPVESFDSATPDDLSNKRAIKLIHDLTPDEPNISAAETPSDGADESHTALKSSKGQILQQLDNIKDGDSGEAISLFNLITGISLPEIEDQTVEPGPSSEIVGPCSSEERLDAAGSSGEEDPTAQQMEDDNHFRPISRSSEYSSDSFSYQDMTETHTTGPYAQLIENADCTFQPIEPVVGTLCTPLELHDEPVICPQVNRKPTQELLSQELVAPVAELQSPLLSCQSFEQQPIDLNHLENSLQAALLPDIKHDPEPTEADEDSIVPGKRPNVERPTVNDEPNLDKVEVCGNISGYSDTESLNDTLMEAGKIEAAVCETVQVENLHLLEKYAVEQSPTYLSPSETDQSLVCSSTDDIQEAVVEAMPIISAADTFTDEPHSAEMQHQNILRSPSDSDAFDGDESSEGEESEPPTNSVFRFPGTELEGQHERLSPASAEFERESSVDTVRSSVPTEMVKQPTKTGTGRRKRKTRPKTLTGSPKPQGDSPPTSPVQTFPAKDLQLSPAGSPDVSADDEVVSDVVSSDNDDLLNSTGLSEGSNWDYYQDPPYSTGTEPEFDIDLEPKLDDSVLQWDDELDANNDTLTLNLSPRDTRPRVVGGAAAARHTSDSEDSDIEDLHYVIQQSSTQLLQADSALRKPRKDVVQSGIYLDPQKYIEWHATCQTNIKCLQVIQEHLESEQGLANLTDDDIQQVLDLIKKWQSLEKIALERKHQSTTLCKIYRDIQAGRKLVKLCDDELSVAAFNDVGELENHFRSLQTFKLNLQSQSHKLQQVTDSIIVFESEHKKIKMAGFTQLVADLNGSIKPTVLSIGKKTTELQYAIVHWHKWNTDCKELESILVKTLYDIEPSELGLCEQRLVELEASFSEYSSLCTGAAHNYTEEKLASLRARLNHLVTESTPAADGAEEGLDNEPLLKDGPESEQLTIKQAYVRSSYPADDDDSGLLSQLSPPPSLYLGSDKLDSHKSSMESGFATMDTERSAGDESNEVLQHAAIHSEECQDAKVMDMVDEVVPVEPELSIVDIPFTVATADATQSLEPAVIITADPSVDNTSAAPDDLDSEDVPSSMGPLAVDVSQGNGQASSDHQTPPTVEDLAPTLPITDQEKIKVANRSKRGKKNKRKGKGKNKTATNTETQAVPVASCSNQTNFDQSHDQYTVTDPVTVGNFEQQTDDTQLSSSFTNTVDSMSSQSQTDMVLTADQSTHLPSPSMSSQGVLTDPVTTSSSTNQTDAYYSIDQSTETDSMPIDMTGDMWTKSTNTPASSNSFCQTDLALPGDVPLNSISIPADKSADNIIIAADVDSSHTDVIADEDEIHHLEKWNVPNVTADEDEAIVSAHGDEVIAPAEEDEVIAPADEDEVIVPAHGDEVIAPADEDEMITPADEDEVIAPADEDEVIAPADEHEVIAPADEDEVIAPAEAEETSTLADIAVPADMIESFSDENRELAVPPEDEAESVLDENLPAEEVQQFELPAVNLDVPADDEIIDLHARADDEEFVVQQTVVRHRGPNDVHVAAANVEKDAADVLHAKAVAKPKYRKSWLTPRVLKYLAAITVSIMFLLALLFLLGPSCCENTRYHKGIFGLRRKYSDLPPH